MNILNSSNAGPSGSADTKKKNSFWKDGYVYASLWSLVVPTIIACVIIYQGKNKESVLEAVLVFPSWIFFLVALYLFLAQKLGADASSRKTWFTGLGENQLKFIVNQSNQLVDILTPGRYEINDKPVEFKFSVKEKESDGSEKTVEKIVTMDQGLLVNRKSKEPSRKTWFGGLYPVLIPPFRRVFSYNWSWQKIADITTMERRTHTDEVVDTLWIIQQHFISIKGIETKGLETFKLEIQPTIKVCYPKKVLFKNDKPGNWLVRLTTEITTKTYDYFSDVDNFAEAVSLISSPQKNGDEVLKKSYVQALLDLNGVQQHKTDEGDDFIVITDPHTGLAAIIGVILLDVAVISIESEEVDSIKKAQRGKLEKEYLLDAEKVEQQIQDTKQEALNKRIVSEAEAKAKAKELELLAKAKGLKEIVDSGGERIAISENLKNLQVLGEKPSVVMNLSEQKDEEDKKGGSK